MKWLVRRKRGGTIKSVDLQRIYLDAAKERYLGRDEQTDYVLAEWESTLDALDTDPNLLADKLDWVAKRKLMLDFMAAEKGVEWGDDVLHSLDLEYHNVNPATGLYYGLEQAGLMRRETSDLRIYEAMATPPSNTRAKGRGIIIDRLLAVGSRDYVIDWDLIYINKRRHLELKNPFHDYEPEATAFAASL
jgi:proteasome accessory factor A